MDIAVSPIEIYPASPGRGGQLLADREESISQVFGDCNSFLQHTANFFPDKSQGGHSGLGVRLRDRRGKVKNISKVAQKFAFMV